MAKRLGSNGKDGWRQSQCCKVAGCRNHIDVDVKRTIFVKAKTFVCESFSEWLSAQTCQKTNSPYGSLIPQELVSFVDFGSQQPDVHCRFAARRVLVCV